ncbi:hypothetical protein LINPERPRIM_LOCUS20276 [Linum perenne]
MEKIGDEKTSSEFGPLPTTVPSSSDILASGSLDSFAGSVPNHNIGETPIGVHASGSVPVVNLSTSDDHIMQV